MNKSYKDLNIWQKGIELVKQVYILSAELPQDEKYGITSQLRRAAISVPLNIAEGWSRKNTKEYIQFLHISISSAAEIDTLFILIKELKLLKSTAHLDKACAVNNEIQKLLYSTVNKLKTYL